MLDTNTLIYCLNKRPPAVAERISALAAGDAPCMSFVTYAELLKGAHGSVHKAAVLASLELLLRQVPVVQTAGRAMCEHYARISVQLRVAGTPIGSNDLWIAAHALAEGATLVTNNLREFQRVEGLVLENWASA